MLGAKGSWKEKALLRGAYSWILDQMQQMSVRESSRGWEGSGEDATDTRERLRRLWSNKFSKTMLQDSREEGQEERRQRKARQEPATAQGDAGNRWCLESAAKAASLSQETQHILNPVQQAQRWGEPDRRWEEAGSTSSPMAKAWEDEAWSGWEGK